MADPKPRNPSSRPFFEVAVVGSGVDPLTVPAEQLAKLLLETVSLLREIASERGVDLTPVSLHKVVKGSAAYRLYSIDPSADPVFERVATHTRAAVANRGKQSRPLVQKALRRLWEVEKPGGLRFAVRNVRATKQSKAVHMAEPIARRQVKLTTSTILHGRVVGVEEVKDRIDVKVKVQRGRKLSLKATEEVAEKCAAMFRQDARMRATVQRDEDGCPDDSTWRLEDIEPWEPGKFLQGIDEARERLRSQGIRIDLAETLAALQDEDEDE